MRRDAPHHGKASASTPRSCANMPRCVVSGIPSTLPSRAPVIPSRPPLAIMASAIARSPASLVSRQPGAPANSAAAAAGDNDGQAEPVSETVAAAPVASSVDEVAGAAPSATDAVAPPAAAEASARRHRTSASTAATRPQPPQLLTPAVMRESAGTTQAIVGPLGMCSRTASTCTPSVKRRALIRGHD